MVCISLHSSEIDKVKAIDKISIVIYATHPNLLDFYKFLHQFIIFQSSYYFIHYSKGKYQEITAVFSKRASTIIT